VAGARDGVRGGAAGCGTDPNGNPIDCDTQTLIAVTDPGWEVEGPIAQCPAFLKPYNCLNTGTHLAGDLTNIRNAPYFPASRERMCRDRLRAYFAGMGGAYNSIARSWPSPQQATATSSPGCNYLINQLHMPDPVPQLSREQIDMARVSGSGELYNQLMNLADVASQSGLQRDLGAYSISQKALALFQIKVNLDPGILIDADPAAFNAAVSEILGVWPTPSKSARKRPISTANGSKP
jgi:hypothetical protein